jgi:hypothetical protein
VSLGLADHQGNLFDDLSRFCSEELAESSIYAVLHRERERLFSDGLFADLFSQRGRRSVPPSVVATVMVLQRLEGLSDREATERYAFDVRWRYACGAGGYDSGSWTRFVHTVLVDMRARLAASDNPRRIFEVSVQAAKKAGLVGVRRVLDSTPLYDAVATMDTITLIRSAIRGLFKLADDDLKTELSLLLHSGDDYASSSKPQIDWDDHEARLALIDSRAKDGFGLLWALEGRQLGIELSEAAELLATILGQDLAKTEEGAFFIARRVAKDRVISTVDRQARHGRKTTAHGYDGYRGHLALDPDSEIITATVVSPANSGDASVAPELIKDLVSGKHKGRSGRRANRPGKRAAKKARARADQPGVYGDASYGSGEFLSHLEDNDIFPATKTQPPTAPGGLYTKEQFFIDLPAGLVTCPAGITVAIVSNESGEGSASFARSCCGCLLRQRCTTAKAGRSVSINRYEQILLNQRARCADPDWAADYRATRPKVERKIAHLMRRRHGGRRARVRGRDKVDADFNLLAAATNLARLAALGFASTVNG